MEHIWSVLCRTAITDKDRNTLSLIETMEQINFAAEGEVEGLPYEASIVSMWWRSKDDISEIAHERLIILSPNREPIITSPMQEINLKDYRRSRNTLNFSGLPFRGNGVYRFVIQLSEDEGKNWKDVASVPLEIIRDFST